MLASVGGSTSASAQSTPSEAPPGNSAVDQYRESLPPSSPNQRRLNRRDRDALRREGSDGRALADVLERSGGVPRDAAASSAGGAAAPEGGDWGGAAGRGADDRPARERDRKADDRDASPGAADADSGSASGERPRSVAPAAAASTVGPVPVWALLVGAAAVVGVGLGIRVRTSR